MVERDVSQKWLEMEDASVWTDGRVAREEIRMLKDEV
jgi:hypothetical protein